MTSTASGRPPATPMLRVHNLAVSLDGPDQSLDHPLGVAEPASTSGCSPIRSTRWTGWWGDDPPFHHDVFVLTHHARDPIAMQGRTTFHFVTDGIESALQQAYDAAGGADVRLGGGASAVQ